MEPLSPVSPITRPAFGTGTELLPSGKERGTGPLAVRIIGKGTLDHIAGMTEWHSLPLIVFPPSLCHSLPFSLSRSHIPVSFFHLVCVFALISPPAVTPWDPIQCLPAVVILGTWEIKSLLMTDDHRFVQRWAAICNDTDMLCAFYTVLKAVSVQPCQVTGWISSNIMKYIIKVLVNKANVLSSSSHTIDLEIAKSLRRINGSFISRYLTEIWGPFFEELFMILQRLEQIMTSCGHHSLCFSGTSLAH